MVQDRKSENEKDIGNKYEELVNFNQNRVQTEVPQDSIDTLKSEDDSNSDDGGTIPLSVIIDEILKT